MNKKNYALVNKNTGKQWRMAATREEARELKRMKGFKHMIVSLVTGNTIR
jgi:hypothetical protein